ncbi:MAG: hypothetical protein IPJ41_16715 [Phycisphaerales bacterium]|nr:hypothetical protein [Phycisphaerales bacterium]
MKYFPAILACCSLTAGAAIAGVMTQSVAPLSHSIVEPENVEGVISSVDLDNGTFSVRTTASPTPIKITVNEKTLYMLNGASSTKEEALKVGNKVKVTHEANVASSVSASTPK